MKKLAFVIPWFSKDISGGAEIALRDLTQHLAADGVELEILTTCVKSFASDWGTNFFPLGTETIHGITVRRFWADRRAPKAFGALNVKLMAGTRLNRDEETIFLNEMVNSDDLYDFIRLHHDDYGLFVFIPYMFGTTYFGAAAAGDKAVLIPCFHDEAYAHMQCFQYRYSRVKGMAFLSDPESDFAHELCDLSAVHTEVLGLGVDEVPGDAARFRQKYGIRDPFVLYAGRKETGKKVDLLLKHFARYKLYHQTPLKLVLIGGGQIDIPDEVEEDVLDLGFVSREDKYDAYAAATVFCQPSWYESFSIVIMESWLAKRPVLVSGQCAVTRNFVCKSGGGLYFEDYPTFAGAMDRLLGDPELARRMGENGHAFVQEHFVWPRVTERYRRFFEQLCENYPE